MGIYTIPFLNLKKKPGKKLLNIIFRSQAGMKVIIKEFNIDGDKRPC